MAVIDKEKLFELVEQEKSKKKHTVMIVDDEKTQLDSLEKLLSREYEVIKAGSGHKALEIIDDMNKPGEKISVIISDQKMPGLTGIELFERLIDKLPNTIRIILTAFDEKDIIIDSINKAKIYEFILKPFEPIDLLQRVKNAVGVIELQNKLVEASFTDYLTRMRNRRYLNEYIADYLNGKGLIIPGIISDERRQPVAPGSHFAFLLLDLDEFGEINDTYGHTVGDDVLKQFAKIIEEEFRKTDLIIRWGGDEFLIVTPFSDRQQIKDLADRFCKRVEAEPFILEDNETTHLTCSIGFAVYPFLDAGHDEQFSWQEVFDIADRALYAVKWTCKKAWIGLFSTEKTIPGKLYIQSGKKRKKMLPGIEALVSTNQLEVETSFSIKDMIWEKAKN